MLNANIDMEDVTEDECFERIDDEEDELNEEALWGELENAGREEVTEGQEDHHRGEVYGVPLLGHQKIEKQWRLKMT